MSKSKPQPTTIDGQILSSATGSGVCGFELGFHNIIQIVRHLVSNAMGILISHPSLLPHNCYSFVWYKVADVQMFRKSKRFGINYIEL